MTDLNNIDGFAIEHLHALDALIGHLARATGTVGWDGVETTPDDAVIALYHLVSDEAMAALATYREIGWPTDDEDEA